VCAFFPQFYLGSLKHIWQASLGQTTIRNVFKRSLIVSTTHCRLFIPFWMRFCGKVPFLRCTSKGRCLVLARFPRPEGPHPCATPCATPCAIPRATGPCGTTVSYSCLPFSIPVLPLDMAAVSEERPNKSLESRTEGRSAWIKMRMVQVLSETFKVAWTFAFLFLTASAGPD
jgi:hypothetical protein